MSAFKEAFNNMSTSNSAPNLSIRGQAGGSGAPSTRGISNALRAAGIGGRSGRNTPGADGMDVDAAPGPGGGNGSGVGRARGGKHRAVRADPMSQAGRSSGPRGTHARRASDSGPRASLADRLSGPDRSHPSGSGPSRGSHAGVELIRGRDAQGRSTNRARNAGTPPLLRSKDKAEETQAKREQAAKVTAVFNGEPFKAWLVSRYLGNGRMDMSKLPEDQFLKDNNIDHIGMRTAATNLGALLWRLIQVRIQDENEPIRVLSLANNNLSSLRQLDRLGSTLPHITALDFSYNPIASISELSNLLAAAEKRGRATSGHGGLKHLQELILTGCTFREEMISKPNGEATYKHEILRRFPMLRMLDGKLLNRVVFPIERQAKETYNEQTRAQLAARPFTFPADVRDGLIEFEGIKPLADQFCAKFFDLYDNNRPALLPAYAPGSTFSISCNPTSSRSLIATQVDATRHDRPRQGPFTPYVDLPSRNFLRSATSIEVRMQTLKSVDQPNELLKQWAAIPPTKHPLTDASKWMLDNWVLDKWDGPNGTEATIMLVVQGEFQELDGTKGFRSFSRTFVLKTLPDNAPQQGWTLQILSDTLIVHPYLSNAATMGVQRTLVGNGVTIDAPLPVAPPAPAPAPSSAPVTSASNPLEGLNEQQIAIAQQLSQATGMNAYFSVMCAAGNEWDYQRALTNFGEIRGTIPADAFQQ